MKYLNLWNNVKIKLKPQPLTNNSKIIMNGLEAVVSISLVIMIGTFSRVYLYLRNDALDPNEAAVVISAINKIFHSFFTSPLEFYQIVPLGFMFCLKICVNLFGYSEYILRLYPFLCGIASLFIFLLLLRVYVKPGIIWFALLFFASSVNQIELTSRILQRSTDVPIALIAYLVVTFIWFKNLSSLKLIIFYLFTIVLIWMAFPVFFIFAGFSACTLLFSFINKNYNRSSKVTYFTICWILSAICYYYLYLHFLMPQRFNGFIWKEGGNSLFI